MVDTVLPRATDTSVPTKVGTYQSNIDAFHLGSDPFAAQRDLTPRSLAPSRAVPLRLREVLVTAVGGFAIHMHALPFGNPTDAGERHVQRFGEVVQCLALVGGGGEAQFVVVAPAQCAVCLLYTSPSPRDS